MMTKLFVSTPCFSIPQLLAPHECLNLRYMPVSSQLSTAASRFRAPKKRITGREDRNSSLNRMATVRGNVESAAVPTSVPVRVAHELLQAGHRYLDVRTAEEFSAGHAVGAINVPYMFKVGSGMTKNPNFLEEVLLHFGKDDEIIVGCQLGKRSLMAATDLISAGFTGVTDIAGALYEQAQAMFDNAIYTWLLAVVHMAVKQAKLTNNNFEAEFGHIPPVQRTVLEILPLLHPAEHLSSMWSFFLGELLHYLPISNSSIQSVEDKPEQTSTAHHTHGTKLAPDLIMVVMRRRRRGGCWLGLEFGR